MADAPTVGAVISGMVSLLSAYMTYRVGMKNAEAATPAPRPDDDTLKQGESAMNIVRTGVSQYGNEDEKANLAGFERNPQRYEQQLAQVLSEIALRYPVFRQELESFARQNEIKPSVQATANVHGNNYGPNVGNVQGNLEGGSYTVNERNRE